MKEARFPGPFPHPSFLELSDLSNPDKELACGQQPGHRYSYCLTYSFTVGFKQRAKGQSSTSDVEEGEQQGWCPDM